MKTDFINPLLIEEAMKNGGSLDLDFSNSLHYEHIMNVMGLKEDNGSNLIRGYGNSELMEVLETQKERDANKKVKLAMLMAEKASNEDSDKSEEEDRSVFYITAPICKSASAPANLAADGNNLAIMTTAVAKYSEVKAGITSNVTLRDGKTGKKFASCFSKIRDSNELVSGLDGDYSEFMGKTAKSITGFGTSIAIGEDDNGETDCSAKLTAQTDFTVMGGDDAIEEFTVIDPHVKRPGKPKNEPIKVSYKRNTQMGEYDYSIPNEPSNNKIKLILPVSFSVQSTESVTIVDLDRDRGARLYFDDPKGGQCQYCNDLDNAEVVFENIGGKTRKMTVKLPQDWNTLYDFTLLENKVSVNMSIYAEFYVKLRLDEGIDISLSVTFKNDNTTTFEDTRNKLIPQIYMQWGCIGKDTLVRRYDEDAGNIENALVSELKINDVVMLPNGNKAVVRDIVTGDDGYIWDIVTSKHKIKLSPSHSICTERGWIPVSDIRTDDKIATEDGLEEIIAFDYVPYNQKVYNFIFDEETPIYGNGILIGDYKMQQRIRSVMEKKVDFSKKTYKAVDELFDLMSNLY